MTERPARGRQDERRSAPSASSTPRPSTASPTSCAGPSSTASWSPVRRCARSRIAASLGVSRPTVREALTVLVAEGLATREPNRGVSVASPQADSVRDVCAARLVLEGAGIRRWGAATEEQRALVRATLDAYITAIEAEASYQELNERHLAFHVSLVGLTGSPRLVAMQENLVVELKLALAQVDRIRRNAHDQADSHAALVRLLEGDDIDAAYDFLVAAPRRCPGGDHRGCSGVRDLTDSPA